MTNTVDEPGSSRVAILPVKLPDRDTLYGAYMPFIRNGGLFVATSRQFSLGEEVILILSLMDEPERFTVPGRVVWVTPKAAEGYRTPGVGVEFGPEDGGSTRTRIEVHLAGSLDAERSTLTM